MNMLRMRTIWWGLLLAGMSIAVAAQNTTPTGGNSQAPPTSQTENTTQSGSQGTPPSPAFGQNAPILNPENPPLSGLDEPSLEMRMANRSFVSAAIQAGESGDSNANNALGGSSGQAVTHLLGAADLQKFWPKSDLFLEYLGGVVTSDDRSFVRQLQAAGLEAVTRWRTGQLTLRDGASYLPDGSFSASIGGRFAGIRHRYRAAGTRLAGRLSP